MSTYPNLLAQAEKLRRHNRQGSFQTKDRYYEAFKRFLRFVAEEYRLEKLQNLSGKHMHSYFVYLKAKGLAASTIKTEASAIRFWHDQIPNAKHTLQSNADLSLERRRFGEKDRTWSDSSYSQMLLECVGADRLDYASCMALARHLGMRIHEVLRLDAATARKALKTGILTFRGKNGLWRSVSINEQVRIALRDSLAHTKPGQKLFVPEGEKTHTIINDLETFIREHRAKLRFQDADGRAPITFHGLRHTFVKEHYTRLRRAGDTDLAACRKLAPLLGHKRPEIVHCYLAKDLVARFEKSGECRIMKEEELTCI